MKFIGAVLLGLVVIAISHSTILGMAIGLFAVFALDRLDLGWLRR